MLKHTGFSRYVSAIYFARSGSPGIRTFFAISPFFAAIPAQETLRAAETINPPFELSYWHFAMQTAQQWRERMGQQRSLEWDEMIDKLSPLASNNEGLYLAAETAIDTYKDIRYTSDHMAVLGAVGILPMNKLIREDYMKNTLHWIWDNCRKDF